MKKEIFKDFDFENFWEKIEPYSEEYVEEDLTDEKILSVENELGYKLPESYIEFMRFQNGGMPNLTCFPTNEPTSWAENHVAISGFYAIGRDKPYSLCGDSGNKFMIEDWEYPEIGIYICDCPSAGHDLILLDYSKCGKDGEPEVVHVDQEDDYKITFLAKDFETFVKGLVSYEVFEEKLSNEELNEREKENLDSWFLNKAQ